MKAIFTIFLATVFGTGCYTQVKSSGDYWGYTGHHEREKVVVVPDGTPTTGDSLYYPDNLRQRSDDGYSLNSGSSDETVVNNYYYYDDPYVNYTPPALTLSYNWGYGWHRPWWSVGYSSYYSNYYDPYWDWYYPTGFSPYGCLVEPYYPYYYYSHSYGSNYHGYGSYEGSEFGHLNTHRGRISGGEERGRTNSTIGTPPRVVGTAMDPALGRSTGTTTSGNEARTTRHNISGTPTVVDYNGRNSNPTSPTLRVNVPSKPVDKGTETSTQDAKTAPRQNSSPDVNQTPETRPTKDVAPATQSAPAPQKQPSKDVEKTNGRGGRQSYYVPIPNSQSRSYQRQNKNYASRPSQPLYSRPSRNNSPNLNRSYAHSSGTSASTHSPAHPAGATHRGR
ncbi:MAG: hypothetical protein WCH46_11015 [bacterium]